MALDDLIALERMYTQLEELQDDDHELEEAGDVVSLVLEEQLQSPGATQRAPVAHHAAARSRGSVEAVAAP